MSLRWKKIFPNIVKLSDRLGNQMFQFAFAESLRLKGGCSVLIDENTAWCQPVLRDAFGFDYPVTRSLRSIPTRVRRMLPGMQLGKSRFLYLEGEDMDYTPEVYDLVGTHFEGYWQTEKYFADPALRAHIRKLFRCPDRLREHPEFIRWHDRIRSTESVGLHIRGTDYLSSKFYPMHGCICTRRYYRAACDHMLDAHPGAVFYVFTDDTRYAQSMLDLFPEDRCVMVTTGLRDYEEFHLLSLCRHHIMANSSFSWWAAWLTHDPRSTDIAPDVWINGRNVRDIYTDWMIRLPSGTGEEE